MNKRNQLTIAIISIIITLGSIATPLMIRDYDRIINDFVNSPIFPPPIIREGTLNLYYSSVYTEDNSSTILLETTILNAFNENESVDRIWITIIDISLLGRKAGNSKFFESESEFDILDALDETLLLKSGNITASAYAGIQLHFNPDIIVQVGNESYPFEIQGNNVVVLPFNMFNQENNTVDLNIVENTIHDVLLDFNLVLFWQNNTARIMTKALVMD